FTLVEGEQRSKITGRSARDGSEHRITDAARHRMFGALTGRGSDGESPSNPHTPLLRKADGLRWPQDRRKSADFFWGERGWHRSHGRRSQDAPLVSSEFRPLNTLIATRCQVSARAVSSAWTERHPGFPAAVAPGTKVRFRRKGLRPCVE